MPDPKITDTAPWAVVTPDEGKHELRFYGAVQSKLTGEGGLKTLRDMAALFNRTGKTPLPAVRCAADSKDPEAYQKKHAKKSPLLIPKPTKNDMKATATPPAAPVVELIDAMRFRRYPSNRKISNEEITKMEKSIREVGILQPITARRVTPEKESHPDLEIVIGETRYLGASMIDVRYPIPVFIKDLSDKEAAKLNAIENFQRKNLDEIEEARSIANLKEQGFNTTEIMEMLGCKKDHIYLRLNLLKLDEAAHVAIRDGNLSLRTAEKISGLPEEQRSLALTAVVNPTHAHKALPEREAMQLIDTQFVEPAKKAQEWRERRGVVEENCPGAKWLEFEEARKIPHWESGHESADAQPAWKWLSDAARQQELVVPTWGELAKKHSAPMVIGVNYSGEAGAYVLIAPLIDAEKAAFDDKPEECIFTHNLAVQKVKEETEKRKQEEEAERQAMNAENKAIVSLFLQPDGIKKTAIAKIVETLSIDVMECYQDFDGLVDIFEIEEDDDDWTKTQAAVSKYLRSKNFTSPFEAYARISFALYFKGCHSSDFVILFEAGALKEAAFPAHHRAYQKHVADKAQREREIAEREAAKAAAETQPEEAA